MEKPTKNHTECWTPITNPILKTILGVVNPSGVFHSVKKLDIPQNYQNMPKPKEDIHSQCWTSVLNPVTNSLLCLVDSQGGVFLPTEVTLAENEEKVNKEAPEEIPLNKENDTKEALKNSIEAVKIHDTGKSSCSALY